MLPAVPGRETAAMDREYMENLSTKKCFSLLLCLILGRPKSGAYTIPIENTGNTEENSDLGSGGSGGPFLL